MHISIRKETVIKNHRLIGALLRRPTETWDEEFIRMYRLVELRTSVGCEGAAEELSELGEITAVLRASKRYQALKQ